MSRRPAYRRLPLAFAGSPDILMLWLDAAERVREPV